MNVLLLRDDESALTLQLAWELCDDGMQLGEALLVLLRRRLLCLCGRSLQRVTLLRHRVQPRTQLQDLSPQWRQRSQVQLSHTRLSIALISVLIGPPQLLGKMFNLSRRTSLFISWLTPKPSNSHSHSRRYNMQLQVIKTHDPKQLQLSPVKKKTFSR